jgi:hypothetical protein
MTTPPPDDTSIATPPDKAARDKYLANVDREFAASAARRRELAKTTALRRFGRSLASLLRGGRVRCIEVPPSR